MSSIFKQKHSPSPSKLSSQQYNHLTVKQIHSQYPKFNIDCYTPIEQYLQPLSSNAHQIMELKSNPSKRREMVFQILAQIKQNDSQYLNFKNFAKQTIQQKALNISQMHSRKNTFSVDCLRQVMSFPFKSQIQLPFYNFTSFFKIPLDKQLRRVLWQKTLASQQTKKQFFKWDHELTPYNIDLQFRITLERLAQNEKLKLKQSQKDIAIKILEYTVKKSQILPNRSQVYLALNQIQLFSYYHPSKINELGALYCGLQNLSNFYFEPRLDQRLNNIFRALQLTDEQSYELINKHFFQDQDKQTASKLQLNQIYQQFRLSLGSKFLPLPVSQYLIDQLLIKKRNKFDMYVFFAIVILILGDNIQNLLKVNEQNSNKSLNNQENNNQLEKKLKSPQKKSISPEKKLISPKKSQNKNSRIANSIQQISFKSIFNNSKQIIKKQDIIETFSVIYQKIPAIYPSSYQLQETNKLFQFLLQQEQIQENQLLSKINQQQGQKIQHEQIDQLQRQLKKLKRQSNLEDQELQDFVKIIDSKNYPERLGERKKEKFSK